MRVSLSSLLITLWAFATTALARADDTTIRVDAGKSSHAASRYWNGACIEDVNHEIYGGIYSQMIFGESFQEPPRPVPLRGFTAHGGVWSTREGVLEAGPGDGPKLISEEPAFADGEVDLSNAILIHSGGWKKLEAQKVSNAEFRAALKRRFGLENVFNFYGFVEQIGSVFIEGPDGLLYPPNFTDVIIRRPHSWEPAAIGEDYELSWVPAGRARSGWGSLDRVRDLAAAGRLAADRGPVEP